MDENINKKTPPRSLDAKKDMLRKQKQNLDSKKEELHSLTENFETITQNVDNQQETTVVNTNSGAKDGQEKCPKCGSTDIALNMATGKLRCNFCRHEFEPESATGMVDDVSKLKGKIIGSGAQNIQADTKDVITLKCESCGAEIVIDTNEAAQARCHWCRNTLSINSQIPNGSIPDVVLPFSVKKEEAKAEIEKFVNERKFFAHPIFRKEFTTENIMGVYFPYMLIDINAKADFSGEGEEEVRHYTVGSGDDEEDRYDADLYHVERKFDIAINELSIESSADKLDKHNKEKTTNIINSIMPFDTKNAVKWNANYLKGFTSEKRDTNIDQLDKVVKAQSKDVAKYKINDTLGKYDRGVRWDKRDLSIEGEQWKAAYLPVWLYSYQQKKGDKSLLHYVAVNARTKETMGSVPINFIKLWIFTIIMEIIGLLMIAFIDFGDYSDYRWGLLAPGIVFFSIMYSRYRNKDARHTYEYETVSNISNLVKVDDYIRRETGLRNSMMSGANNFALEGEDVSLDENDEKDNKNNKKKKLLKK